MLEGLRGLDRNLAIAAKGAISRARTRLGWKALALQCTPENVAEFGLHSSKEGPAAFGLLRLVALVEVGTHVVLRPVTASSPPSPTRRAGPTNQIKGINYRDAVVVI